MNFYRQFKAISKQKIQYNLYIKNIYFTVVYDFF